MAMKNLFSVILIFLCVSVTAQNIFVDILQNEVDICTGDLVNLTAVDSSFTPSIGHMDPLGMFVRQVQISMVMVL